MTTTQPRFLRPAPVLVAGCFFAAALCAACSSKSNDDASPPSTGGMQAAGGQASTGGTISSGGAAVTGGLPATGGIAATGGTTSQGGTTAQGGSSEQGGTAVQGGSAAQGGTTAQGGISAQGGTTAQGGAGGRDAGTAAPDAATDRATGGSTSAGGATGAGGKTGAGGTTAGGGSTHTGQWKVMMLGDSITGTCYPQILSSQLIAGKHTNFQFVGTQQANNTGCGANTPGVKTEGHGGYGVTYLPATSTRGKCDKQPQGCGSYAELQTWAAEAPEIVLMHFATNDIWDGRATSEILSSFVAVITEFRKNNPNVIFFVSKIIKLSPTGCGSCLTNVAALAAALTPAWATANATPSSPIFIVDHYDCGFDPTNKADTADGVHPTPAGATMMATTSYDALVASGYF